MDTKALICPKMKPNKQMFNFGFKKNSLEFTKQVNFPNKERKHGVAAKAGYFNFTLPMAAWMRFRDMKWRPILEMSGAAIGRFCGFACVAMVVPMLFRLDLYTGRTSHFGHAHH